MKHEQEKIRRLPNGAIDIDHYAMRAHRIRSDGAFRGTRAAASSVAALKAHIIDRFCKITAVRLIESDTLGKRSLAR